MSKYDNLLLVVNLLLNRRSLTLKEIMAQCGVSERTAYRYIQAVDSAGFPVYYNPDAGAYCLVEKSIKGLLFTATELALLRISLEFLEGRLSPFSADVFRRVRAKFESVTPRNPRGLLGAPIPKLSNERGVLEQVYLSVINGVRQEGRALRLELTQAIDKSTSVILHEPAIEFNGEWQVREAQRGRPGKPIPLRQIQDLEIDL